MAVDTGAGAPGPDLPGTGRPGVGIPGAGIPGAGLAGSPGTPAVLLPGRDRKFRLPRSPKIIVGLALLAAFLILAIVGPLITPFDPTVSLSTVNGVPQPPSHAHLLGTTQLQQDVFSQLLAGGRSTFLVAFIAGAVATVLSVIMGVTAGYVGGLGDDTLSMLAKDRKSTRLNSSHVRISY